MLARLQNRHEGDESHNSELEEESDDEEGNDEGMRREENTTAGPTVTATSHNNGSEGGYQTIFAVDLNISRSYATPRLSST